MTRIEQLISTYPELDVCAADIQAASEVLRDCYRRGGKLLTCGNGGSAADAEHIVGELMKGYMLKRPVPEDTRARLLALNPQDGDYLATHLQGTLPAISLVSQTSLISAIANDTAADIVFAQQVYGYGREGDVLLGLSTSGNARNAIHAMQVARALGLHTVGLTGPTGGLLKPLCEVCICVPGESTAAIQERHMPIYHVLCAMLEEEFFRA
ncbi:MAG TPA: SIS domain-containing protein [Anaerolineales bacterium]|nr:SIS domain-containing protein [Anaerolineales bacterium]